MAQVITYRPNSVQVTAAQTAANNGMSFLVNPVTLPNWDRFLLFGVVTDTIGNPIPNAGVRVYHLSNTSDPMTPANLIATVFTDMQGEYGISLTTLPSPEVYGTEAFAPGN